MARDAHCAVHGECVGRGSVVQTGPTEDDYALWSSFGHEHGFRGGLKAMGLDEFLSSENTPSGFEHNSWEELGISKKQRDHLVTLNGSKLAAPADTHSELQFMMQFYDSL